MNAFKLMPTIASAIILSMAGHALADNTSDVKQPLWFKEPSAALVAKAKIDDLSNIVVGEGPRGEEGVLYSDVKVSDEQLAKIKAGNFTVAIALGWPGLACAVAVIVMLPFRDFLRIGQNREEVRLGDFFLMVLAFSLLNAMLESFLFSRNNPVWISTWLAIVGLRLLASRRRVEGGLAGPAAAH